MWEKIRGFVYNSRIGTVVLTILLLLVGMATAALVNWISVSPIFAKSFYLGATVAITMILLGIALFTPFFKFRFKYLFLDHYEEEVASYLFNVKKKSENWVDSIDGIIGIRLFRIEKHTLNDEILFNFNSIFDCHSKYTKLKKLRPNKLKKHIYIDTWIEQEFKFLNADAFENLPKLNKYMEQILLYYLDEYKSGFDYEQQQRLIEISRNWEPRIFDRKIFKSIHYTSVFKDRDSYEIFVNNKKLRFKEPRITNKHVYWEDYSPSSEGNDNKINRRYYNLHLRLKNKKEGVNDFILQIIVDKRLILQEEIVYSFMKNVLK